MIFNVNSPTKVYDGDLLSRGCLQYAGTIQYKIGNWSVGAKYNYSGHNNYTVSNLPILRYNENKDWKPLQHMARLTATYTFSVGKSRRHDGKILTESSKDNTGLGKFNPNRSLEKTSCHFLMTAIRKTALYMLDS